jgi:hypothetical protein
LKKIVVQTGNEVLYSTTPDDWCSQTCRSIDPMKQMIFAIVGLMISGVVMADSAIEDAQSKAMSDMIDKTYQAVGESNNSSCQDWGKQQGLEGDALTSFLNECSDSMGQVRPIGADSSE